MTRQSSMFGRALAPLPSSIDLRCCGASEMLGSIDDGVADLVVADPPWDGYGPRPGTTAPDGVYDLLTEAEIGAHLIGAARVLRPGGRLAMWTCWPLLVDVLNQVAKGRPLPPWLDVPGIEWKSGGAWSKSHRLSTGFGYHWRGRSEPVLLGVRRGVSAARPAMLVFSGHHSEPGEHSRKPVSWQQQWARGWVPAGGLVVDVYAGLGSVAEAVALAGEGRRYIGAEIDAERHAQACSMVARGAR